MRLTDINDIKSLLSRHGFRFSKSKGQNFLTQAWVIEDIAESAQPDESTAVLEIGPGIGCLTEELSRRAGRVIAVELDAALAPVLAETLSDFDNIELIFGDILKLDLPALVTEKMAGYRPAVCANLPYNITSPVLIKLLKSKLFETVTVMVQREAAQRICAAPGSSDYGAFSIFCGWYCTCEILFEVPPDCFIPQPKVTSAVIRLTRRDAPPARVNDEEFFFSLVRAAFNLRRKTLANAIGALVSDVSKEQACEAIVKCGFSPNIRGEILGINEFAQISNFLKP